MLNEKAPPGLFFACPLWFRKVVEDNHLGMGGVRIGYLLPVARLLALAKVGGRVSRRA